jgi:hypothetical protein
MLTRRDVAMLTWYGLLFSAIVLWASLRPSGVAHNAMPRGTSDSETLDRAENLPEVRHVMQRMAR